MPGPSRRTVLMGGIGLLVAGCGAGYELIQDGTLPGKYALARLDGACGSAPPPPRGARAAAAGLETSRIALLGESMGGGRIGPGKSVSKKLPHEAVHAQAK